MWSSRPKAIALLLALLMLVAIAAQAGYLDEVVADGASAYWPMNEGGGATAYDSIGTAHGALNGATWTQGMLGGGVAFDGLNDYVDVTAFPAETVSALTVELWAKPADKQAKQVLLNEQSGDTVWFVFDNNGADKFDLYLGNTTNKGYHSTNTAVTRGEWNHLAFTYDDATDEAKLYVNGQLDRTVTTSGTPGLDSTLNFGWREDHTSDAYKGALDEIAVYKGTALSPGRIAAHYVAAHGWPMADTMVLRLDEGGGTVVRDTSPSQLTGTLHGPTWAPGKFGSCLSFDDNGDYVSFSPFPAGSYPQLSFEAWVNLADKQGRNELLNEQDHDTLWLNFDTNGADKMDIYLGDTTNRGYHSTNQAIPRGEWTHVAFTYDDLADELKLYVNGLLDRTVTTSGTLNFDTSVLLGKRESDSASTSFRGLADELAFYSRVLTDTEILARYADGAPRALPEPATLALLAGGLAVLRVRRRRA